MTCASADCKVVKARTPTTAKLGVNAVQINREGYPYSACGLRPMILSQIPAIGYEHA